MILDVKSKPKEPIILIGLPDVGLVGIIAVSYLIEELRMEEIGYMDAEPFHPLVIVHNGQVKKPIRLYEHGNIISVISDIPITPLLTMEFAKVLVDWAKSIRARLIVNITGIPVQDRLSIDKPQVLALATDYRMDDLGINTFNNGFIMGTYASLINESIKNEVASVTLLAETYPNFPDPTASISALEVVNKMLKINVSLERLEKEAEIIRLKTRELMKQTESILARSKVSVPSIYR